MAVDVFSIPVFLVVFRESLEAVVIVSILLAFLKQTLGQPDRQNTNDNDSADRPSDPDSRNTPYRQLVRQIWAGTLTGLLICVVIASALIAVFYTLGADRWAASEENYEGAFALVASLIISVVGAALLRIGRMQAKWRTKLAAALPGGKKQDRQDGQEQSGRRQSRWWTARIGWIGSRMKLLAERYALFVLPFVTVLREGIEAIVFVAGVSFSAPAKSVPLPVFVGLLAGIFVGYLLYKGGSSTRLRFFLVASTCLLYLVAAGLFSRAIWSFEMQTWNDVVGSDAAELGSGPGSYDIDRSVWHINCCNPELSGGGGWGFFNAILGWTNSATYGSVLAYNLYWLTVMVTFFALRYHEVRGHWPLTKPRKTTTMAAMVEQPNAASISKNMGHVVGTEIIPERLA